MQQRARGHPLVVIPALDEEDSVAGVIREVHAALPGVDVLVVDDGSRDDTARRARDAGATTLVLPFNLGVGGAMRAGFRYAERSGYDCVVQIDADGQHDPADLPRLLAAVADGADVVIGARFAGLGSYRVGAARRVAMAVLARVLSTMCGVRLTDVTSGYRVSAGPALRLFAGDFPEEYFGDTLESLVMAARAGLRITQVPVQMRQRVGGRPSQSPLAAVSYLSRAGLVILLARLRRRPQLPPPRLPPAGVAAR